MSTLLSRRDRVALCCVLLSSVGLVLPVQAQLGGLRRAVERRVEQKAEDRVQVANLIEPTFDQTTLEITAARLDRYQAAMTALRSQRAANRQRYEAMQTQRSATADSANQADNQAERTTYERASQRFADCRNDVRSAAEAEQERKTQELAGRMQRDPVGAQNDPKVKQMMAIMQAMSAAQQSGDTVAVNRAIARMTTLMGGILDSASLDKAALPRCGARPRKPASMVRAELLKARADSIEVVARQLMSTSGGVKGADVGMTDVQSRMFWERIQSFLNGIRQDAPITRTFSKAEYDLLVSRRAALKTAFSGSD